MSKRNSLKPFTVVLSTEGHRPSVDDLEVLQVMARGPRSALTAAIKKLAADCPYLFEEEVEEKISDDWLRPFLCFEGHGKCHYAP